MTQAEDHGHGDKLRVLDLFSGIARFDLEEQAERWIAEHSA